MPAAGATRVAFVSNSARGEYTGRMKWLAPLRAQGFDVTFVLPRGEESYVARLEQAGARVLTYRLDRRAFRPGDDLRTFAELARLFRAERFDIVHTFGHKANIFGAVAAALARAPLIINHMIGLGAAFAAGGGARRVAIRQTLLGLYRGVQRLVTLFLFQNADDLRELSFLPAAKRILVGGTGVDTQALAPGTADAAAVAALRRELGLADGSVVITYVGRLLIEKGIPEILAAARALTARDPRLAFLLVGSLDAGGGRSLGAAELERYKSGPIRFLGRRDDVKELLALTDVFVNPSYYGEGVPRTNLEALAMGVPVVTTDSRGCRDTVLHGETGLIVPPREPAALERALALLIESPELRARLGASARKDAVARFSVEGSVQRVADVYRDALTGRRPASAG